MKTLQQIEALTQWVPAWHDTGNCMDRRHILWLYEILTRLDIDRTLEIGVYSGCSSAAFVHAEVADAHFCDVTRRADAMSVIEGRGTFHQRKGCDVLRDESLFDLVFVDGAHDYASVSEELTALIDKTPTIIVAHDVNSSAVGFPHCEGAHYLWETLQGWGWQCWVDAKDRPGEMTKRGMLVGVKDGMSWIGNEIRQAYQAIL